ncbi:hypothetical protein ACW7BJ_16205 [Azospirillum argentinense]
MNPLERIDYPEGRFGPKMLHINDEITAREAKLIAESHGFELLFRTEEVPDHLWDSGDFTAILAEVDPLETLDGGWTLVGAHDDEDGEVVLTYARPIPEQNVEKEAA